MDKVDTGQSGLDKVDGEEQIVYHCRGCNYESPSRGAAVKHRQRTHHQVDGVNAQGQVVDQIGKVKKPVLVASGPQRPQISGEGSEHIREHYKGYSEDKESILFIMHPGGKIRDFRLEHPLIYPVYELMKKERNYGGDFPQFMADAVETLFANAGYELALAPKSQSAMYQEVLRLLAEGKLELQCEGDQLRLGVKDGDKNGRTEGSASLRGEAAVDLS